MPLHDAIRLHRTTPSASAVRQIDSLQVLRGVAVTLVAWFHAGFAFWVGSENHLPEFGIFGIDLFFVISGFIISLVALRSQEGPGGLAAWQFLLKRLIRIYPIYWIYALLAFALYAHRHQVSTDRLVSLLLLPNPKFPLLLAVSWTLLFEMWFYLVVSFVLLFTVRYVVHVSLALFLVAIALGKIFAIHSQSLAVVLNPISIEFMLGAVLAVVFTRSGVRPVTGKVMLAAGVVLALFLRTHSAFAAQNVLDILAGRSVFARVFTWGLAAGLMVAGAVLWSPKVQTRAGRMAVAIGNASYSAYLASPLVLDFTPRYLYRAFRPRLPISVPATAVFQTSCVLAVLLFGWLSYQFVEWPLVRTLQRRLVRRPVASGYSAAASERGNPAEASEESLPSRVRVPR